MRTVLLAIAVAAVAAPAFAVDTFTAPDWVRRPTPEMLRGVWPKAAMSTGKGGKATIDCKVSTNGLLFDCTIFSEEPAGMGFGGAALAMTPQLLMKPARRNGQPVVGQARIPITFSVPGGGAIETFGSHPVVSPAMAWRRAPTYPEVAAAYPQKAKAAGLGGLATLQCGLTGTGALRSCHVLREEPRGYGFGAAAQEVARLFQAFPPPPDGPKLDGASVQLPIAFDPAMLKAGDPVVGKPNWAHLPSAEAIAAAFPKAPAGVSTLRTTIQCRVEQGGGVSGCSVQREEPAGQGFGAGALSLSSQFRLGTWSMEGLPVVGGLVNIPLRYDVKATAAAPAGK